VLVRLDDREVKARQIELMDGAIISAKVVSGPR
jgi:hypothetical protein